MIPVCSRKGAIFHLNPILSQSLSTCQVGLLASVKKKKTSRVSSLTGVLEHRLDKVACCPSKAHHCQKLLQSTAVQALKQH